MDRAYRRCASAASFQNSCTRLPWSRAAFSARRLKANSICSNWRPKAAPSSAARSGASARLYVEAMAKPLELGRERRGVGQIRDRDGMFGDHAFLVGRDDEDGDWGGFRADN